MSMKEAGFLSPDMDRWRDAIRADPTFKPWFDLADELNRIALSLQMAHKPFVHCVACLTLSLAFCRAHQSFQAAILLAERGMVADSRSASRSCVDTVLHMHALAADPEFVDSMISDHIGWRKLMAQKLREGEREKELTPEMLAKLEEAVERFKGAKTDRIRWEQVVKRYQLDDLYQLVFRPLSNDGTHCSVDSLNRHVVIGPDGKIAGIKCGPSASGVEDAIQVACIAMLWALRPMVQVYGSGDTERRAAEWFNRYVELVPEVAEAPAETEV